MARARQLGNAPISEALIDLRTRLPEGFQADGFRSFAGELRDAYPNPSDLRKRSYEIRNGRPVATESEEDSLYGVIYKSSDGLEIAQFRLDGFTFNRLKPYTSWDDVYRKAQDLWRAYAEIASPEAITRIAVRYINHMPGPSPEQHPSAYLKAPLPAPKSLRELVTTFLSRVVIRDPETGLLANIIQAVDEGAGEETTLVLDIDAYMAHEYRVCDEGVWDAFEALRGLKNRIFFDSITEQLVRRLE